MNYTKKSTAPGWNDPPMLSTSAPMQVISYYFFRQNKLYKIVSFSCLGMYKTVLNFNYKFKIL